MGLFLLISLRRGGIRHKSGTVTMVRYALIWAGVSATILLVTVVAYYAPLVPLLIGGPIHPRTGSHGPYLSRSPRKDDDDG